MKSEYYELVIVGGGPAGCSTALWTKMLRPQPARRILVLEKRRHPRLKVCAGGLTVRALRMLARMGLSLNIPYTQINHIRLLFENHSAAIARPDCMRIIRRDQFDAMLADAVRAAGVEMREEEDVVALRYRGGMFDVQTPERRYRADVVVGADGARGLTHRLLPGYALHPLVGLAADTPACGGDGDDFALGRATVDFTCNASGVAGYVWHFPFCDGGRTRFNRGIFCSLDKTAKRGDVGPALEAALHLRGVEAGARPMGGFGGGYYPRRRLSAPHFLLAGDAAGGNTLTGEGIAQALMYGRLAAEEISRAFERGDFSFRHYTARVAHSELGRSMNECRRVAKSFYRRGPGIALPSIAADAEIGEKVADFMAGVETDATRRALLTRLLAGCLLHGAPAPGDMWKIFSLLMRKDAHLKNR